MQKFLKNRSLRARIAIILSSISFFIWIITAGVNWYKLHKEIYQQFDAQLILFAERLASSNITQGFHPIRKNDFFYNKKLDDDSLAFAIFTDDGHQIFHDGRDGKYIPFTAYNGKNGFTNPKFSEEDDDDDIEEWRIYWLEDDDIVIAVGQEIEYRHKLIFSAVMSQVWGWIIGLPLSILTIVWILSKELESLYILEKQIQRRKPDETTSIQYGNLPREILPLVSSLNRYFERTNSMINRERRFTSDAAHELRSPLAALRIQTEIAQMTLEDEEEHKRSLANMTNSIDRISQLIDQLLTLSRLDNIDHLEDLEEISWKSIIDSNVSQLYRQAEQKESDIYVEIESEPQDQKGKVMLLSLILRNLLENAINYTPNGSLIKIKLTQNSLVVEDNGKGVSQDDLDKLGQPFFRPADRPVQSEKDSRGSGLGLSIIRRIVELHGFSLQLAESELGGLKVRILF